MPSPQILIYGLQRSGTNFLEAQLRRRFRLHLANRNTRRDRPEQKHFRLYADKDLVPEAEFRNELQVDSLAGFEAALDLPAPPDAYFVISKDPYAWYLSYCRWAYQHDWPEVPHHYIEEYNQFYGAWLAFGRESDRVHFVQYGQLLARPQATLDELAARAGLQRRRWPWLTLLPRNVRRATRRFPERRKKYYLDAVYLADFDPEELDALNHQLDEEVLQGLGYVKYEGL